jgi:hypothetical protein
VLAERSESSKLTLRLDMQTDTQNTHRKWGGAHHPQASTGLISLFSPRPTFSTAPHAARHVACRNYFVSACTQSSYLYPDGCLNHVAHMQPDSHSQTPKEARQEQRLLARMMPSSMIRGEAKPLVQLHASLCTLAPLRADVHTRISQPDCGDPQAHMHDSPTSPASSCTSKSQESPYASVTCYPTPQYAPCQSWLQCCPTGWHTLRSRSPVTCCKARPV